MKKLINISIALFTMLSTTVFASTISVISSDRGLFVGNSASSLETVAVLSGTEIANNLSDNNITTYTFGSRNAGNTSATLTLEFTDTVTNQAGDDIAFYFMGGSQEINFMDICFTNNCTPSDRLEASFLSKVGAQIGDTTYATSLITIDLSNYGFGTDEILGAFSIDIIADIDESNPDLRYRLAGIDNLNTLTPVPVPAAFFLFLSGIASLGLFARRKS